MDADKIKNFFLLHGEKFVVALVIVASAWMVYGGLQMPDMRNEKQPDQLMADANQVRASIDDDHNEAILPIRVPTFDIVAETLKKQAPVDPTPYALPNLLERQEIESSLRRGDPILVAPLELRTSGHIESIAVQGARNRVTDLEDADELEKIEAPVARAPRSRSRGRGRGGMGMDGMGMDGMDMDGMGMDGMGMDGMDMDGMGMDGMGMGMDGMGMDGSMMDSGGKRQLSAEYNFGFPVATASSSTTGSSTKEPGPQNAWFIAGSALLPHKVISESYREKLAEADGYLPIRDQPLYFNYEIQRAEVTNKTVDQLEDKDWIQIANRESDLKRAAFVWAGYAPELVHSDYRDVNLTGYIPPVLINDYSSFAVHPMIPKESRKELEQIEFLESQDDVEVDSAENTELADLGSSTGMGMGMGGMDSGMDYGDMDMDMDMGAGMGMSMGMGMSASMAMVEQDPVEHKIMRFYDFARGGDPKSPMPGRTYVYRIRYAVQDPNFPANPIQQPKSSTLQGDVYTRVQELMKQAVETKKRDFQRWSPWSEPSPPATLPGFNDYFAGPVEQSKLRSFDVAGRVVQYAKSPPKAKVLSLNHNVQFSASMPVWLDEITEGSALAAKGELEIIDPISLKVKKVPEAKALSGTTVIDLEGGQSLEIEDKDTLVEPGMMLIYDEFGGLKVSSEIDDQERYRIFSFAKERGL